MVGLDSVADLQRLGLERFHCTYVCTYVIYVYTYIYNIDFYHPQTQAIVSFSLSVTCILFQVSIIISPLLLAVGNFNSSCLMCLP